MAIVLEPLHTEYPISTHGVLCVYEPQSLINYMWSRRQHHRKSAPAKALLNSGILLPSGLLSSTRSKLTIKLNRRKPKCKRLNAAPCYAVVGVVEPMRGLAAMTPFPEATKLIESGDHSIGVPPLFHLGGAGHPLTRYALTCQNAPRLVDVVIISWFQAEAASSLDRVVSITVADALAL